MNHVIKGFKQVQDEVEVIKAQIKAFKQFDYHSLGIICKAQKEAEWLEGKLTEFMSSIYLLNAQSVSFVKGIVLASAHMAKGLEFDKVIVPFV